MFSVMRQLHDQMPREKGFGLIEVMIAIAIFSVGIIGCYRLQLSGTSSTALANRVSTSSTWATYVVERLMSLNYEDPDLDDDGSGSASSAGLDDIEGQADGVIYIQADGTFSNSSATTYYYSVSWNIAQNTTAAPDANVLRDVKQIRVIVRRNGGIGDGILYTHDYYKTEEF